MPDATPEAPPPPRGIRLDGTITVGNVLQIATLVLGFSLWLLASSGKVDATARDVSALQKTVAEQAASTREAMAAQSGGTRDAMREALSRVEGSLAGIQQQIREIPTMGERVRVAEGSIAKGEERDASQEARFEGRRVWVDGELDKLRQGVAVLRADLDAIRRASIVNLPGSRGLRP